MMKKFRSICNDLAIEVFYDPEIRAKKNAIFASGFPAFPAPNGFVEMLTQIGYIVYSPHYYGAFDSNGTFSFDSMVQTIIDTEDVIQTKLEGAKADFNKAPIDHCSLLVGQSFGGIASAYSANQLKHLETLIISSSGLRYSSFETNTGLNENLNEHLVMVREKWRNSYRISSLDDWLFVADGKLPKEPKYYNHECLQVFNLIGQNDEYFDTDKIFSTNEQVCKILLGGGIEFNAVEIPNAGHPVDEIARNLPSEFLLQFSV